MFSCTAGILQLTNAVKQIGSIDVLTHPPLPDKPAVKARRYDNGIAAVFYISLMPRSLPNREANDSQNVLSGGRCLQLRGCCAAGSIHFAQTRVQLAAAAQCLFGGDCRCEWRSASGFDRHRPAFADFSGRWEWRVSHHAR